MKPSNGRRAERGVKEKFLCDANLPPDAPRPDLILAGIDALAELLARLP